MKRLKLLLLAVAALIGATAFAATAPSYIVNEFFTGLTAYPSGWSTGTALYGASAGVTIGSDKLTVSGAGSGTRGLTINFPYSSSEPLVYVDFDWTITSATLGQKNALGLMMNDASGNPILCLYAAGSDAKFHYWNQSLDTAAFVGGSFNKASSVDIAGTNALNITTRIDLPYATGVTYNVKATLDFTNHIVTSLILTNTTTSTSVTVTNKAFINAAASNISKISLTNTRSSIAGNGLSANMNTSIDNFKTYKMVEIAGTANVTVNYLDTEGNPVKTARTEADQAIGSTYTTLATDKASFNDGSFYYAYDAASTTADNVAVASGGSAINLKFKKTALTAGTYTWTNAASANWNETEANFSTDGSNSLAYQNGNEVAFTSAASQKAVSLTGAIDLNDKNVNLAGDGYTLAGTGSLTGSGTLNLNLNSGETASLNLTNNLTGGVAVNGGTAVILKDGAASKLSVANGASLNLSTGTAFSKAIAGTTGTLNIIPTSNVSYTSAITNIDVLNYALTSAGSVTTAGVFSAMPILNNTFSGTINVGTALSSAMFGSTTSFTNNKLALGDNVLMAYTVNPASDGSTIVAIGELSGTSAAKIQGARLRTLTYNIGGLNTDAVFAGAFENFGADAWGNTPVLNITKTGTGSLTLSGNSSAYLSGTATVNEGKLIVTGTLGTTAVTATVGTEGTLSGTGIIGGATTVNGTLEGSLNFSSSLTLAGTTNLMVNGFNTGEYNVVNVAGAVNNGGILNVTVNASAPETNTAIKLINANTYNQSFATINVPSGYSFNETTGILTYNGVTNGIQSGNSDALSIYPTLSKGNIYITGVKSAVVEIINIAGVVAKQVVINDENATIQLNGLANGTYFVKARLADGSVKVQKVVLQK